MSDWLPENTPELLLDQDALNAPDWLSDEDCQHALGSDWCRRGTTQTSEDME